MSKRLRGTKHDRVSDLPDPILCHILSFLPTKFAAGTSILSKRWKPIWLSVPTIDLMETFSPPVLLSIMQSRDTKSPILLARLRCADYEEQDFTQFILSTTQRGVQTLDLNMVDSFSFAIESQSNILTNILNCKTLTVLKLSNLIIERDIPQINVSSVKTLDLTGVFFRHTNYYCFFSAFPNLEELHAVSVIVVGRRRNIPRIEEMKAMNKCLPKLVRATARNMELIPFFSFARRLILTLKKTLRHVMVQFPIFNNLTQLELLFNFSSSGVERWKWRWLQKMVQHSPKLQHLIIHEKNEFEIDGNIWEEPATIPECLSSQLKTCLFSGYNGSDSELQFAQYIMQNSKVLLNLTIQTIPSMDLSKKYQVLQKLSEYSRGCKLLFH